MTTLRRRLVRTNLILGAGLVLMAVAGIWGVTSLRARVLEVVDEYEELRILERSAIAVFDARARLEAVLADRTAAGAALDDAIGWLERFEEHQSRTEGGGESHQDAEAAIVEPLLASLRGSREALESGAANRDVAAELERAISALRTLEGETDPAVARRLAVRQSSVALVVVVSFAGVLAASSLAAGILGYRGVMVPVGRLQEGVRRLARGRFDSRIEPAGDEELAELAREFNRMATELDTLYRVMEEKVEEKSRELVRSERLASVGFLAAGVAHELNNPLGIITGHAELAERGLERRPGDADAVREAAEALALIREEAFRCKGITEQLLSLSARSDEGRRDLSPLEVVESVLTLVRGLPAARHREIVVVESDPQLRVCASEPELKQVLLNLMLNAIAASDAEDGPIELRLAVDGEACRIEVRDHGCGIAPEVLGSVFEPFYTRRRRGARGVGLGLAISHAIVEAHGGSLRVTSDGPGAGATFTVRLPLVGRTLAAAIGRNDR